MPDKNSKNSKDIKNTTIDWIKLPATASSTSSILSLPTEIVEEMKKENSKGDSLLTSALLSSTMLIYSDIIFPKSKQKDK